MKIDMDKVQKWKETLKKVMTEIDNYTDELAEEFETKSQTFHESDEGIMISTSIEELDTAVDVIKDILGYVGYIEQVPE